MSTRTVKVFFNEEIRRARLSESASYKDLKDLIARLFGEAVSAAAKITYKDEDGDNVLILSDEELKEAMNDAKAQGKSLKLKIELGATPTVSMKPFPSPKIPKPEKAAPTSTLSPAATQSRGSESSVPDDFELVKEEDAKSIPEPKNPYPEVEKPKTAVEEKPKVEKLNTTVEEKPKTTEEERPHANNKNERINEERERIDEERKRRIKRENQERKRVNKERNQERKRVDQERKAERKRINQERKAERKREKDERRREKDEFKRCHGPKWRRQWRQHKSDQRDKAREEFCDEIKSFLEDEKIITALQEALPLAADMLVKGEELKTIIDAILEAQPVLKNHALVIRMLPLVNAFLGFIPTEVVGPVLLDVILDLQQMFKDGKPDMPIRRLFKRIVGSVKRSVRNMTPDVHHGVVCDMCPEGTGPIVGNRWKKKGANYDLCGKCYDEVDDETKANFVNVEVHGWRPPCAFGIPGFHPGAFMGMFGGPRMFGGPCGPFGGRGPCGPFGGRGPRGPFGGPFGGGGGFPEPYQRRGGRHCRKHNNNNNNAEKAATEKETEKETGNDTWTAKDNE